VKALDELSRTEFDSDGNLVTWLALNRDNMNRYNRFLRAVEESKSNFVKDSRQNEIHRALSSLKPILSTLTHQAKELQEGGDRELLASQIKDTIAQIQRETVNVAEVVKSREDDVLISPWTQTSATSALEKVGIPTPEQASSPPIPVLNPQSDPKFLQVATKLISDIKRVGDKITLNTDSLRLPVVAAQQIAARITDVGAAIREKNPRKIVEGAKATQKSVQDLLNASKDFLAQCKDERLKQQYLNEIRAIESITTQLKIIAAVCASQTDDVSSQEKLLNLTEKISQATQRALRAAELCVLAIRK
jgi:hypothetical protein